MKIVRCPMCGSTRAGVNEGRSVLDLTFMECKGCGHNGLQDVHERDHNWVSTIELAPDEAIPAYLAPLAPQEWHHHNIEEMTEMTEVDVVPPRVFGCENCFGDDPEKAWEASRVRRKLTPLIEDSHFSVRVSECACGQTFVTVFIEKVDLKGGEDDQTWRVLPIAEGELEVLTSSPRGLIGNLQTFGQDRRYLKRRYPTGGSLEVKWESRGFTAEPQI